MVILPRLHYFVVGLFVTFGKIVDRVSRSHLLFTLEAREVM